MIKNRVVGLIAMSFFIQAYGAGSVIESPSVIIANLARKVKKDLRSQGYQGECLDARAYGQASAMYLFKGRRQSDVIDQLDWPRLEKELAPEVLAKSTPQDIATALERIFDIQMLDAHRKCHVQYVHSYISFIRSMLIVASKSATATSRHILENADKILSRVR